MIILNGDRFKPVWLVALGEHIDFNMRADSI
jgi:hypothetical protein